MSCRLVIITDSGDKFWTEGIDESRDEVAASIAKTLKAPGSVVTTHSPEGVTLVPVRVIRCVRIEEERETESD